MKAIDLMYALNNVGSDFVEEAEFAEVKYVKVEKQNTGISRRFVAALIAACLVLSLGIVAYATGFFGLVDYLSNRGLDAEVVESLTNDVAVDAVTHKNQYAEYTVLEAVADKQIIYVSAKVQPLDDSYFLVPESVFTDDPVAVLGIPGLESENTKIKEYVEAHGKTYVQVALGCKLGDDVITTMKDFSYGEDGTLYLYTSNENTSDSQKFTIKCIGSAVTEGMNLADKVEFEVQIEDRSTYDTYSFTNFDDSVFADTGITVKSLNVEETEMGLYVSFDFENEGDKIATDAVSFKIYAADGTELRYLPGTGGTVSDNGNGSFEATMSFQKPVSIDGLMFGIRDVFNAVNYGPYQISIG
ncbi:MAG: hypothetical protein IJ364_02590 [Oscillospiraceae bacterium]|nr:hypothetical protein [Oscillospiraceae bacterium]